MSYGDSNPIALLMPNANSYDYPTSYHSPFLSAEFGFGLTSQHQSDGDPTEDYPEGEQQTHSCYGYLLNELDSSDSFFNGQDPYENSQNGCRVENTELILFHNEDQLEDCNGDPRNLYYEFDWDCFQSWIGLGEAEPELNPENDCNSDAMALIEAILGY